jgi:hypothetical protein
MIIEESEFDQNKAYSQKEWTFCFSVSRLLRTRITSHGFD